MGRLRPYELSTGCSRACEDDCRKLGIDPLPEDPNDHRWARDQLAKAVLNAARLGERNPSVLSDMALTFGMRNWHLQRHDCGNRTECHESVARNFYACFLSPTRGAEDHSGAPQAIAGLFLFGGEVSRCAWGDYLVGKTRNLTASGMKPHDGSLPECQWPGSAPNWMASIGGQKPKMS